MAHYVATRMASPIFSGRDSDLPEEMTWNVVAPHDWLPLPELPKVFSPVQPFCLLLSNFPYYMPKGPTSRTSDSERT